MIVYLNDDFEGGDTVFPDDDRTVRPEIGKAILFSPQLRHGADAVISGTKYILRTEVLYTEDF